MYCKRYERIKEPTGVCQGPNNSVLVCSEDTHSLVQVSVSGRVIGSHKLDMCYPRTVCMSKGREGNRRVKWCIEK